MEKEFIESEKTIESPPKEIVVTRAGRRMTLSKYKQYLKDKGYFIEVESNNVKQRTKKQIYVLCNLMIIMSVAVFCCGLYFIPENIMWLKHLVSFISGVVIGNCVVTIIRTQIK